MAAIHIIFEDYPLAIATYIRLHNLQLQASSSSFASPAVPYKERILHIQRYSQAMVQRLSGKLTGAQRKKREKALKGIVRV